MIIRCYHRYKSYRQPVVVHRFLYKGFEIQILDTHQRGFKYEYRLIPIGSSKALSGIQSMRARKWAKKFGVDPHVRITDPTSHRFQKLCSEYARMHVNELRAPFYLEDWHDTTPTAFK